MPALWETVDRLIHDLGAIRAFVDEAEAVAEAADAPEMARVRGAMDTATGAITRLFDTQEDAAVEAAWEAIAHAQDAMRAARPLVARARARHDNAPALTDHARGEASRARDDSDAAAEQMARLRRSLGATARPPGPRRSRADATED
jgi:hypothetical protein